MVVRLPEAALARAFAGASCTCATTGGCDRPTAVPPALSHHVDFIEGIGKRADYAALFRAPHQTTRDYDPSSRRRAAQHRKAQDEKRMPTRRSGDTAGPHPKAEGKSGPWFPKCLKSEATPPCLKQAYRCNTTLAAATANAQGVALFGGQFFSPSDLASFEEQFKLPQQTVTVLNDNDPGTPGNEASLDVQYITGIWPRGVDAQYRKAPGNPRLQRAPLAPEPKILNPKSRWAQGLG